MTRIPKATTIRVALKAFDSTDHITAKTGLTLVIKLSKNMAAFANPNAGATNATEVASGWYYVDLDTTDTGTEGPLIVRGTSAGADDVETVLFVVKATNGGFTALPDAAAEAAGGLFTRGSGAGQLSQSANGELGVATLAKTLTTYTGNTPQTGDAYARLGAPAGASVSADIAAAKSDTAAIKAKTDNLPSDPADESLIIAATDAIMSRIGAPAGASVSADIAAIESDTTAIKARTDNLPLEPADEAAIIAATTAIVSRLSTIATKTGSVQADAGNTLATFKTDLTEATDDHYKDCLLKITSGTLREQVKKIRAYSGTTKFVTVSGGFTSAPAASDTFEIVND